MADRIDESERRGASTDRFLDGETLVVLALIAVGVLGCMLWWWLARSPILTAAFLALAISAAIFRFLGGVEGNNVTVGTLKFGGSAAVFIGVMLTVNDRLQTQALIDPHPDSWIAMDKTFGSPREITVNGMTLPLPQGSSLMQNVVWMGRPEEAALRVTVTESGEEIELGKIESRSLMEIGLFNEVGEAGTVRFTGEMYAGSIESLTPTYSYQIEATGFADSDNGVRVMDEGGTEVYSGSLQSRDLAFFEHDGERFLVFVVRAIHNNPQQDPYAVFGFAQIQTRLNLDPAD